MCSIDAFVAEDSIDREIACGAWVRSKFVKHIGGDGGGMSSENEFESLILIIRVAIAYGPVLARFVDFPHVFEILLVVLLGFFW